MSVDGMALRYGWQTWHGERGVLAVDADGQKVQCHICGQWRRGLGAHIRLHEITAKDYRREFGLCASTKLTSPAVKALQRIRYEENLRRWVERHPERVAEYRDNLRHVRHKGQQKSLEELRRPSYHRAVSAMLQAAHTPEAAAKRSATMTGNPLVWTPERRASIAFHNAMRKRTLGRGRSTV